MDAPDQRDSGLSRVTLFPRLIDIQLANVAPRSRRTPPIRSGVRRATRRIDLRNTLVDPTERHSRKPPPKTRQSCSAVRKRATPAVPRIGALFAEAQAGSLILPLMIFHQLQPFACAVIARRYTRTEMPSSAVTAAGLAVST